MTPAPTEIDAAQRRVGTLHAVLAYTLWGLLPVYWKAMAGVPMWETLAHRALWSLVAILILLAAIGRIGDFTRILRDRSLLLRLGVSAFLIGSNWSLYVFSIDTNQ